MIPFIILILINLNIVFCSKKSLENTAGDIDGNDSIDLF